ncbi:hypothetical protein M407DRAFT_240600 [Tulasnella calospora MUT 4182]|uniref:Uncharacterized protein n=1 Tax=Tulasnella calospora MUT 4182 TaxID=1051891 RepID=A0A0C3QZF7_9AGAM|nr:hypothetical protein M407DRAFT_240600 [Tulasnella calospora MUT 4182]
MDPDKDLLVLMEKPPKKTATAPNPPLAVHLLALRDPDANPHPLAEHPILYYQPPIWNRKYHYWVQVVGDVLAVMFIPEVRQQDEAIADQLLDELVIWKWKTGKAVTNIRCEPGYEAGSFSFLTNDIVVIPCTKDEKYPELRLYQLPTATTSSQASPSTSAPSNLLAIFHFPEFTNSVRQCGIMCRADPSPWAPPPSNPVHRDAKSSEKDYDVPIWPAHGTAPFAPHPSNRLLVITLDIITLVRWPTWGMPQLQGQQALSRKHTAFTTAEVLLRAWKKGLETRETEGLNLADGCSVVELPWEDWGPTGTRMLSEATDQSAVCYVYGLRYIRLAAMGEDEDRAVHIRLMDFNDREFDRVYHEDAVAQTAGAEEEFARSEGACGAPEAPETSTPIGINEGASESGSETHEEAETEQLVIGDDDGDSDWVDEDEDAAGDEESEEEEAEIDDEDLDLEAEDNSSRRTLRQRRQDAIPGFGDLCILRPEEKARCERTRVALHESYVEDILVFKNRITTSLPFRWSFKTAPEVQRWTSCMLDDEHIIGLKRTQRVALDEIAVSVDILTL